MPQEFTVELSKVRQVIQGQLPAVEGAIADLTRALEAARAAGDKDKIDHNERQLAKARVIQTHLQECHYQMEADCCDSLFNCTFVPI